MEARTKLKIYIKVAFKWKN